MAGLSRPAGDNAERNCTEEQLTVRRRTGSTLLGDAGMAPHDPQIAKAILVKPDVQGTVAVGPWPKAPPVLPSARHRKVAKAAMKHGDACLSRDSHGDVGPSHAGCCGAVLTEMRTGGHAPTLSAEIDCYAQVQ